MSIRTHPRRAGFTLIEALVAMAVLSVSLTPIFAQVGASFRLSRAIQESLTASMLAQEGMEVVRGLRDDDWFDGDPNDFGSALNSNLGACIPGPCRIHVPLDPDDPNMLAFTDEPLKRDVQGRFQYDSGQDTPFRRDIAIAELAAGQLEVTSTVRWETPGQPPREVVVTGYLFDWLDF